MELGIVGQRCVSEREPELGLGRVASVDPGAKRIAVDFPAVGERRLYALGTAVLKRVQFRAGDSITLRDGSALTVERVDDAAGLLVYVCGKRRIGEAELSDSMAVGAPHERLLAAQSDPNEVFDLRLRALQLQARLRQSDVRGFLGGRVELLPHQFYILNEVASRQLPRVLLADEVGLGKTIEACLILQRLLSVGQVSRALILVPESLVHQWFVELLRRFNLWFGIFDEARCVAVEESDPGENPFLSTQLALCSVDFLTANETRREQALAAGWGMIIVDEAHHLAWSPEAPSPEYLLVERLAQQSPGLLLLTATPTQLGLAGHFARLRLLDPARYRDLASFMEEAESYAAVADVAGKIVDGKPLQAKERTALAKLFTRDADRLQQHLDALKAGEPGARENLLRALLDQHGIGRVMFRNTRSTMKGFPKRQFCPAPLELRATESITAEFDDDAEVATEETAPGEAVGKSARETFPGLLDPSGAAPDGPERRLAARIARELQAEEAGNVGSIRYSFRNDPRIEWLVALLKKHRAAKVLLICRSQRKAIAIEAALQERMKAKSALFHEGLALVQRDRNAAWFAEPEGAQLLICSEIGSEGRNFQFAHHLVLFDLPLNPGLVEQRIGRLDRIGQTQTIRIHVPYVQGTADECLVEWYDRGLHAFERPLHGGTEFQERFGKRLLGLAARFSRDPAGTRGELDVLIAETEAFRSELDEVMRRGRDRLLELNSFNPKAAQEIIERVRAAETDLTLRNYLLALLDHFGVRVKDHEEGDVFLDPSHAYIESFPAIPADGMLATFDRRRALSREDIVFLSADHPLIRDGTDLLLDSPAGTAAFGVLPSRSKNLLLEAVYVVETVADVRWHVDQFLAPTPVRVVVDVRGRDLTNEKDAATLAGNVDDADLHRFLESPSFSPGILNNMLEAAAVQAKQRAGELKDVAAQKARTLLSSDLQRLRDLQKLNDHVRPEEIGAAEERLTQITAAISNARLRLDSVRLIVEGGG